MRRSFAIRLVPVCEHCWPKACVTSCKNNLDFPCSPCAPCPQPADSRAVSVITIHSISETTPPSCFLPADFQGNRRRLVCYQGGSPGLSKQLSKRHRWEQCASDSVHSQNCCQMRSPCCKRGWRDFRGGEWKKPVQEVEQSVAQGSAQSTHPLEMLISVLPWLADEHVLDGFLLIIISFPFLIQQFPGLTQFSHLLGKGFMGQAAHRFRGQFTHQNWMTLSMSFGNHKAHRSFGTDSASWERSQTCRIGEYQVGSDLRGHVVKFSGQKHGPYELAQHPH